MFLSKDFDTSVKQLQEILQKEKNFDLVYRVITICGKQSALFFVDAFTKDEVIEKIQEFFFSIDNKNNMRDAYTFSKNCVPYCEVDLSADINKIVTEILSGQMALIVEGLFSLIPEPILNARPLNQTKINHFAVPMTDL